ncbi:unnamed protein product [Urochloa decumbens]|uniref:Glycosyltransferase n=1 Tax=Urochloa decumbens TaxID=240449 RepID=A0ABC9DAT3_9POAL
MHLILAPFPTQGHFAAFLSLADRLHVARPSALITLVSTPGNVSNLHAAAAAAKPFLRFHALPFSPEEHGLPAGTQSADAVHAAFDAFLNGVRAGGAPVVVVADPFLAWTSAVARRHGARHAFFDSCSAYGSAVYHSLWNHLPHLLAPPDAGAFCLLDHTEVTVYRSQLPSHFLLAYVSPIRDTDTAILMLMSGRPRGGGSRRQRQAGYRGRRLGGCVDGLLHHPATVGSSEEATRDNSGSEHPLDELEPAGLRMLRRALGVPVLPIGPLLCVPTRHVSHRDPDTDSDSIIRWLDARDRSSVLYISFGSQNSLRPEQMMELAAALEITCRPFVWAFRPPITFDYDDSDKWLPEGFEERARAGDRGLLVRGWVPQLRILAHASTGAFLSHCGWNSVLESAAHSVPVIGWPLQGDQFFNCKMLEEEWGTCLEAARGNMKGSLAVKRARLAEAVEAVLGGTEKGAEMRRRARGIQELIGRAQTTQDNGGSSAQTLEEEFFTLMLRGAAAEEC